MPHLLPLEDCSTLLCSLPNDPARPSRTFRCEGRDIAQAVKGSIVVNSGETMKQVVLMGAGIARMGYFMWQTRSPRDN
jgi:DNA-binding transcriptional LysR family regulator